MTDLTKNLKAPALLHAPEWTHAMGEVPYHYADKPRGSRCLWTVRWLVKFEKQPDGYLAHDPHKVHHVIEIREWEAIGWELSRLPDEALRCELEDLSARTIGMYSQQAAHLLPNTGPEDDWRHLAEAILFQARANYPSAVAPWYPPDELFNVTTRPGWERYPGIVMPKPRSFPV